MSNNNNQKNKSSETITSSNIADVLKHSPETQEAEKAIAEKDAVRKEEQAKVLAATAKPVPTRKTRSERAADRIHEHLDVLVNTHHEDPARSKAWSSIIEIVSRFPNNSVFESVYTCFVQNKNNPNLNEMHALSTIHNLDKEMVMKVRFFYTVINGLVHGHYTRKNLNMELLRSTFGNDDFVNWIVVKLRPNRR